MEGEKTRGLLEGAGADPTAAGATRVAGTANVKSKYAPEGLHDFQDEVGASNDHLDAARHDSLPSLHQFNGRRGIPGRQPKDLLESELR
ncbi:MAG TPA: hypothetical protein VGL53_28180 [Bryobacteraceae bacterium]|jgi:hypothetical protein